jgi:glutamyl-tRNA synthetase
VSSSYRGRFAPSPTGELHLGHARTFLVAWLRAKSANGSIVMRMEDLDPPRVVPGAADAIYRDLEWLGLTWDGEPMVQSERGDAYQAALDRLVETGLVYRCTCSRKDIREASSAPHGVPGLGVRYPGTCRNGPTQPDRPASFRFRLDDPPPAFDDALLGPIDPSPYGGDFILKRATGEWAYQLAVVVDDAAQGITEVVRGADLVPSTPRQIALIRALGFPEVRYLHVPLVLDAEGERLSKRISSITIAEHQASGQSPEEVVGELAASLRLVPKGTRIAADDLIERFDLARLPTEPTRLDLLPA